MKKIAPINLFSSLVRINEMNTFTQCDRSFREGLSLVA